MTATVTNLSGQTEEWKDPRKHLIGLWRKKYKDVRGFEPGSTWGMMMKMMFASFEMLDERTGELLIEYPDEETWLRETDGFFEDRYAFNTNYFFGYFLKRFGSFGRAPKRPVNQLVQSVINKSNVRLIGDPNEKYRCPKCNRIHHRGAACP